MYKDLKMLTKCQGQADTRRIFRVQDIDSCSSIGHNCDMTAITTVPRDIQSVGKHTRQWMVDARMCPLLQTHGITLVGISDALPGFRFVRTRPDMCVLMAARRGRGHAFIDGQYLPFLTEMAYLMPPRVLHAYAATGRNVWRVCWVCYDEAAIQMPINLGDKPKLVRTHAEPLEEAIRGLYREMMGDGEPPVQRLYVELIHEHSMRIAADLRSDERLIKLWATVEGNLAHHWTLSELARRAGMSVELLRLHNKNSSGRSPMKQVAFMRMQRAAVELASTPTKINVIAEEVGYSDPFAFSVAFKRTIGLTPKAYRTRKKSVSIH